MKQYTLQNNILLHVILFLIVLSWGLFSFPFALLGNDLTYIPGDLGDSRFINFVLEHGYQFLRGNQPSFYDAPFFYPATNTLALSDNMAGTLPIYALFRALDYSRETAYQLWWVSLFILNFSAAYYCYFKYSLNRFTALITAYIFSFGLILFGQVGYNQLNILFLLPFVLLQTFRLLVQPHYKNLVYFLVVMLLQLVMGVYYFFLSAFVILCLYLSYAYLHKSQPILKAIFEPSQRKKVIYTLVATFVLAALYMYPYLKISSQIGYHVFNRTVKPGIFSYFIAHDASIWTMINSAGHNAYADSWWLHPFFWGAIPLLLFIGTCILAFKHKTPYQYLVLAILAAMLISLSIQNKYSLYIVFHNLPGFNSLKVLVRVIIVIFTLVLFANTHLLNKLFYQYPKYSLLLFALVMLLATVDNKMDPEKMLRTEKETIINRYATIDSCANNTDKKIIAIVSEEPDDKNYKFHIDAILYAQMKGIKSINGYSSNAPAEFPDFWLNHNRKSLFTWCECNNIDTATVFILDNPNPLSNYNTR